MRRRLQKVFRVDAPGSDDGTSVTIGAFAIAMEDHVLSMNDFIFV